MNEPARGRGSRLVYGLLVIPFVAVLWVPFYDRAEPAVAGIPFFYWYQMVWIPVTVFLLWLVYRVDARGGRP